MTRPGNDGRSDSRRPHRLWMTVALISIVVTAGVLVIVAMAAFVFRPLLFPAQQADAEAHPAVGQPFPGLELEPLFGDAEPVELADLAGRVVLINFWATWCPPCRQELPHLAEMESKFRDRADFRLLAVCHQGKETMAELREAARELLNEQEIEMPTYADPSWTTRTALRQTVGVEVSLPTTVILDRTGVIRGVWQGYRPGMEEEMEALVKRLLGEG